MKLLNFLLTHSPLAMIIWTSIAAGVNFWRNEPSDIYCAIFLVIMSIGWGIIYRTKAFDIK